MKTLNKKSIRYAFALLLILSFLLTAVGCKGDDSDAGTHVLEYEGVNVAECVLIGQYKDLTVYVNEGETNAQAVWRVIYDSSKVLSYPEEQVEYYASQSRARCEYYVSLHSVSYEEALAALGYTEESIISEAKTLVGEDLIGMALRADAGISITEEEKDRLFDRYVEKYAYDWGYNAAYVKENLSEQVLDSMLYDKTTEYLLKNNDFVSAQSK